MIIDIIVILKFYLIFLLKKITGSPVGVSVFDTRVRIRTPSIIIRTSYILLDKLYNSDALIR